MVVCVSETIYSNHHQGRSEDGGWRLLWIIIIHPWY